MWTRKIICRTFGFYNSQMFTAWSKVVNRVEEVKVNKVIAMIILYSCYLYTYSFLCVINKWKDLFCQFHRYGKLPRRNIINISATRYIILFTKASYRLQTLWKDVEWDPYIGLGEHKYIAPLDVILPLETLSTSCNPPFDISFQYVFHKNCVFWYDKNISIVNLKNKLFLSTLFSFPAFPGSLHLIVFVSIILDYSSINPHFRVHRSIF